MLTLSEHALPPHNEHLIQLIRFMGSMRQRLLTMARRVQEQPCWYDEEAEREEEQQKQENSFHSNTTIESSTNDTNRSSETFDEETTESIYRQTSIDDVGHFKCYQNNRVEIQFHNGFLLEMTAEQVQFCQVQRSSIVAHR